MERSHVLVIATVPIDHELLDSVLDVEGAAIHIVAPASKVSHVQWLTNAEDDAREEASVVAERTAGAVPDGAQVETEVGDVDPLQAAEDALREFPASEIVVVVPPADEASWLERASVEDGFARFGLPVRYIVAE